MTSWKLAGLPGYWAWSTRRRSSAASNGATVGSGDALGAAEAPPAGVDPSPIVWACCFLLQAAKATAKSTGTCCRASGNPSPA